MPIPGRLRDVGIGCRIPFGLYDEVAAVREVDGDAMERRAAYQINILSGVRIKAHLAEGIPG